MGAFGNMYWISIANSLVVSSCMGVELALQNIFGDNAYAFGKVNKSFVIILEGTISM